MAKLDALVVICYDSALKLRVCNMFCANSGVRKKLWIVAPCFYDTNSYAKLRRTALERLTNSALDMDIVFVLVDDSGGQDEGVEGEARHHDVLVIPTPYNLGHQGAIVFALRELSNHVSDDDYVVTMDCDGEDRPEDIAALISPLILNGSNLFKLSLAERTKRSESLAFKLCYSVFKLLFVAATGTIVKNGNFASFRGWMVRNVLFHPYFDLCYSSSLLALPLQRSFVPLARGERYFGESKMTLISLVLHGFRMLLPFAERISIRALFVSLALFGLSSCAALIYCTQPAGSGLASKMIVLSSYPFALASIVAICACMFFQLSSQSRALALRGLIQKPAGSRAKNYRQIQQSVVETEPLEQAFLKSR